MPDNIGLEMEYKPPKAPMELRFLFRWLSRDRKSSSDHLVVGGAIAIVMGVHLSCADSPTFASGLTRTPRSLNLDAARRLDIHINGPVHPASLQQRIYLEPVAIATLCHMKRSDSPVNIAFLVPISSMRQKTFI